MAKEISALELRNHFGEIMDEVRYRREPCIVKKNRRRVIVLIDIDTYEASKSRIEEEAFIEEYSDERIKEFLREDKIDKSLQDKVRKELKS